MKKALYGTTVMFAASIVSGQALAVGTPMTSSNFNLTLGGFATFREQYQTQSVGANIGLNGTGRDADGTLTDEFRPYWLDFDAELYFLGSNKLPNGTTMGFRFELETGGAELRNAGGVSANGTTRTRLNTANSDNTQSTTAIPAGSRAYGLNTSTDYIDDNFIYLDGRWGKLTMGGTRDQRFEVGVARTYSSVGAVKAETDPNDPDAVNLVGSNKVQTGSFTSSIDLNNAVNKLIWELPAMGGVRLAINWTPDNGMENSTSPTQKDDSGARGESLHIAGQWAGTVGGIATRLSAGWLTARAEDNSVNTLTASTVAPNSTGCSSTVAVATGTIGLLGCGVSIKNDARWRVGGDFKTGPVLIGGYYAHTLQNAGSIAPEETAIRYGAGATYTVGVWEFGLGWEHATQDVTVRQAGTTFGSVLGVDSGTRWDVGMKYSGLGGGKVVSAGYRRDTFRAIADGLRDTNTKNAATNADKKLDNEGTFKTLGIKLDWTVGPGMVQTFGFENFKYTHHAGASVANGGPVTKTSNGLISQTSLTF